MLKELFKSILLLSVLQLSTAFAGEIHSRNGLTLVWDDEGASIDRCTKRRLVQTFFASYPRMRDRFNPLATNRVTLRAFPSLGVPAQTVGSEIQISSDHFAKFPQDTDALTHELMHVVQAYPAEAIAWLREGIADYAREAYGLNNFSANWSLGQFEASHHYTAGYRISARFLNWTAERYPYAVDVLNVALRRGTYRDELWRAITGYSLSQLWLEYKKTPHLANRRGVTTGAEYRVVAKASGKILSATNAGKGDRSVLVQRALIEDDPSQRFRLIEVDDGLWSLQTTEGKLVSVPESGGQVGTQLELRLSPDTGAGRWRMRLLADGSYQLNSRQTGLAMDLSHSSLQDGAPVQQWEDNGTDAQRWVFVQVAPPTFGGTFCENVAD